MFKLPFLVEREELFLSHTYSEKSFFVLVSAKLAQKKKLFCSLFSG